MYAVAAVALVAIVQLISRRGKPYGGVVMLPVLRVYDRVPCLKEAAVALRCGATSVPPSSLQGSGFFFVEVGRIRNGEQHPEAGPAVVIQGVYLGTKVPKLRSLQDGLR